MKVGTVRPNEDDERNLGPPNIVSWAQEIPFFFDAQAPLSLPGARPMKIMVILGNSSSGLAPGFQGRVFTFTAKTRQKREKLFPL